MYNVSEKGRKTRIKKDLTAKARSRKDLLYPKEDFWCLIILIQIPEKERVDKISPAYAVGQALSGKILKLPNLLFINVLMLKNVSIISQFYHAWFL